MITWVYTEDFQSTCEFYEKILDCRLARDEGSAKIYTPPGISDSQSGIGVCRAFDDRVVEPKGSMISVIVEDVDDCYVSLLERGAEIESPPHVLEQFKIYTFFARDPNGYVIEFQQFLAEPDQRLGINRILNRENF